MGIVSRPRDPTIDTRILAAVRSIAAEAGVESVTMEGVAQLAGVSRPTVYRRWPSRAALLFEAQTNASVASGLPDTGSLTTDLTLAVTQLCTTMAAMERTVAAEQLAAMATSAEFADHVCERRWRPDRDVVMVMWERARARGEVRDDIDGADVIDDIVATCMFRILFRHQEPTAADIDALVHRVIDGVRTMSTKRVGQASLTM